MRTQKKMGAVSLAMIVFLFTTSALMAQRSDSIRSFHRGHKAFGTPEHGAMNLPNLSDDQKAKIKEQQIAFGKEALPLRNQLAEKRAHLHTLQTAQTYDVNAVNATIEDITKTESILMKKQAANREAIRKLLNDEQRLAFDSNKGFGHGPARFHNRHKTGHRN